VAHRLTLTPERFAAQGRAVARVDGKAVLVERGIAGETVEVEVVRAEPRFSVARVVAVLGPSPDRAAPACPHFDACGGCDWQHLRYPAQVALKRQVAQEQLERIGRLTPPADWSIVPAAEPLEYRDKLEWVPVATPAGWAAGLHGRGSATPIPITRCWLAPEAFSRIAALAMAALAAEAPAQSAPQPATQPTPPWGVTRLTVQGGHTAEGALAFTLTLHVRHARQAEPLAALGARLFAQLRQDVPALTTVAVATGEDAEGPGGLRVVAGDGVLHKHVGALRYPVPLDAFFQVHPAQAEQLVRYVLDQVARHLPPHRLPPQQAPRIFDLFCGAGLFTIPLLQAGYAASGAEMSQAAVRSAARAAQLAGVARAAFHVADLDRPRALRHLIRELGHPDAVLVDPPRRGLSKRLTADVAAAAPALLVYVSCDPGTFARDAQRLAARYVLAALRGFDFFPQTQHLELVGTFLRR
jgi:23S rRNA (uracil1939-C5)-methyltransferase